MTGKSYVSMEQHICVVCGQQFDTGSILLDRRLRSSMERHTLTGWGLCPDHQRLFSDGFVALVECDPARSGGLLESGRMKPDHAYRTGQLVHLKREVFTKVFNVPIAPELPCIFVEPGVIQKLQAMAQGGNEPTLTE